MLEAEKHYGEASTGQRFGTYVLDSVFVVIMIFTLALIYGVVIGVLGAAPALGPITARLAVIGFFAAYYFLMEWLLGRTLGKMIIGTRVIRSRGGRPGPKEILIRTLVRLVPFEPFSFLGSAGWHDQWSGTVVVRTRPGKWQQDPMDV